MILQLLLLIVSLFTMIPGVINKSIQPEEWTDYELVAHGLGAIDSHTYTNSLEAFEANYRKGHRLFEVDLLLTTDNYLVTRNNWQPYLYKRFEQAIPSNGQDGKPLPMRQITAMKIMNSYHIMEFSQLLDLLRTYDDIYFITDTKDGDKQRVEKQFRAMLRAAGDEPQLLDRIIPQIYNQVMYKQVEEIHSFSSYIYALYMSPDNQKQVLSFVKENKRIKAVSMPETLAKSRFLKQLKRADVKTYIHTLNDSGKMKDYLEQGAYGFYTDSVTYGDFAAIRPPQSQKAPLWLETIQNVLLLPTIFPTLDWR